MGHEESHHFLRENKSQSRLDRAKLDELNHIFNQILLNKVENMLAVKIQDQLQVVEQVSAVRDIQHNSVVLEICPRNGPC